LVSAELHPTTTDLGSRVARNAGLNAGLVDAPQAERACGRIWFGLSLRGPVSAGFVDRRGVTCRDVIICGGKKIGGAHVT
jgi:hypothetical protein